MVCLAALGIVAFLGSSAPTAAAADECPNPVFRTGPSAKLPDCRAYELVSPRFTGGLPPQAGNVSNTSGAFASPLITSTADSVVFNTLGGALSGFPGTGVNDRYRAKRTADGWVTEFIGASGEQTPEPWYGGFSSEHGYYFMNAGGNGVLLDPNASLQAAFGGKSVEYLHRPDGEFELLAQGSLGETNSATGHLITPGAGHVLFTAKTKLEPEAGPTGMEAIYDRSANGPTRVVSLYPGDGPITGEHAQYLGASSDGSEVAFATSTNTIDNPNRTGLYVRIDNTVTHEVTRRTSVGETLTCNGGPGSATVSYQWLRNGAPIGGATSAEYTIVAADEGKLVQCEVSATLAGEGTSLSASTAPMVAPVSATPPPRPVEPSIDDGGGIAVVGQLLTCSPGAWPGSPTLSYQWFRDGAAIGGATASTYEIDPVDVGTVVQCRVSGTSGGGAAVAFGKVTVAIGLPPRATDDPAVSNLDDPDNPPAAGDELSCAPGTWFNAPTFSYQWLRNGTPIAGATESTYTALAPDDEGDALQCLVTATNADGVVKAVANRVIVDPQPGTSPPEQMSDVGINGNSVVGQSLSCFGGSWEGSPTFSYQWLRDGAEIPTATSSSYLLTAADRLTTIQCRVTATNAGGSVIGLNGHNGARYIRPASPTATATLPDDEFTFGGVFGGHVFYTDGPKGFGGAQVPADLYSFDTSDQTTTQITDVGDALFVNVSDDGSRVYFISKSQIGGGGIAGQPNLYVWSRGDESTTYVETVAPADLVSKQVSPANVSTFESLTFWTRAIGPEQGFGMGGRAAALSRATADGSVLVFESVAQLTGFDNDGHAEIYRYDAEADELTCVSCPTGAGPADGEATFQTGGDGLFDPKPLTHFFPVANLTEDGESVVFESTDSLVPQDGNGKRDVYRWTQGEGVALISTGQALADSYVYAVTPNATDIVISTNERLLPEDENVGTSALYDARVNGGFPPPEKTVTEPCGGDACQGSPSAAPSTPPTTSSSLVGQGDVKAKKRRARARCGKGKHAVRRGGKTRCVKNKGGRKKQRRAGSDRRTAR